MVDSEIRDNYCRGADSGEVTGFNESTWSHWRDARPKMPFVPRSVLLSTLKHGATLSPALGKAIDSVVRRAVPIVAAPAVVPAANPGWQR